MPYKAPGPPEKTGKHRYVFLVFVPANGTTEPLDLTKPKDRQHWGYEFEGERVGVQKWALENGLAPIGETRSSFTPLLSQMPYQYPSDSAIFLMSRKPFRNCLQIDFERHLFYSRDLCLLLHSRQFHIRSE